MERGERSGVPVVFLHAYADSWRSYERVLSHLPPTIHAFAVTQRGHGDADRPASGYALEDFTADLKAFMDAVALEAAVLVGDSSATYTAQRFAIDHPERTLGLTLIGPPLSLRDDPGFAALIESVSKLSDPIAPGFVRKLAERTVSPSVPPDFLEAMVGESLKVPAHVWKATGRGLLEATPPVETATITVPTLILWGDRDELCPRGDQEALAAAIPGSRLLIYQGAGHLVHWEEPERVSADVVALAERVGLREGPAPR